MPGGRHSRGTGRQGEMEELLERYEAGGDESVYAEARRSYEQALAADGDARLLMEFGYLQELHGSRSIGAAVAGRPGAVATPGQTSWSWYGYSLPSMSILRA